MSECVVRMDMPESCEECPLVQTWENDYGDVMSKTCNLIYKGYLSEVPKGERRKDCPIICELPEKHGDLIDRNDYIKAWEETKNKRLFISGLDVAWIAHVTVPAEGIET